MSFKYTGPGYYVTRDGRKALVGEKKDYLIGVIDLTGNQGTTSYRVWFSSGNYFPADCSHTVWCADDLVGPWVDPPKPIECWAVVGTRGHIINTFPSKEKARDWCRRLCNESQAVIHMREVTEDK